jgi:hypothetical protein
MGGALGMVCSLLVIVTATAIGSVVKAMFARCNHCLQHLMHLVVSEEIPQPFNKQVFFNPTSFSTPVAYLLVHC